MTGGSMAQIVVKKTGPRWPRCTSAGHERHWMGPQRARLVCMWRARADRASGSVRVPDVPAAVDGGAVGLAPDGVGDPGRAYRDPEVVAIRERVPGRALVRRAGGEVRELHLARPAIPPVVGCRVPGVERPGAVVLPGQAEVTGGRAAGDLREIAVTLGVDEPRGGPGRSIVRGDRVQALRPVRDGAERVGHDDVPRGIDCYRRGRGVVVGIALEHRAWWRAALVPNVVRAWAPQDKLASPEHRNTPMTPGPF